MIVELESKIKNALAGKNYGSNKLIVTTTIQGEVIAGFRDEEKASKYIELIKKDNTLQVVKVERNEENEE